jgi:hypothetical protein
LPPLDPLSVVEVLCNPGRMFWIIILHEPLVVITHEPCIKIPAQTCTLPGCFGFGFITHSFPTSTHMVVQCRINCTELSSVHRTLSNCLHLQVASAQKPFSLFCLSLKS